MTETNRNYNMDNLWNMLSSENEQFGIKGYKVPEQNIDCSKSKKEKEQFEFLEKVWKGKEFYPKPKEIYDKDGKPIPTKKPNYLDDILKVQNYGYSKEKEETLKELYKNKNRTYEVDHDKVVFTNEKEKAKYYKSDRITYFDMLTRNVKKSYEHFPHMEQIIQKAREDIEKSPKKLLSSDELKVKYSKKGSLPKEGRATLFDDSQYLGEKSPYYNSPPKSGNEKDDKFGKYGKLFFPDISPIRIRSPAYGIKKPFLPNLEIKERKQEAAKAKLDEINKSWENRKMKFIDDISVSYGKLNKALGPVDKGEQYKSGRENNPLKSPGPQEYFKSDKYDPNKKPKNEFPRNKTDKKISKPMNSHLF